jgi:PAS domain S-box-containing protein
MSIGSGSRSGPWTGSAVLAIDLGGRAIYCNGVAETMIGRPRLEIIGQPYHQIFRLDDVARPRTVNNAGMKTAGTDSVTTSASILMVLHRDGFVAPVEHASAPIHARDGQITGAMITFRYLAGEAQAA